MATPAPELAVEGGPPVRPQLLPYGRQWIDEDDVAAVADVLRSEALTTGPRVAEFESVFARTVGARHAVAVSNGTAALHTAVFALGLGPGDEVIIPPLTFAATANCAVYQGATPVFADIDPQTLLLDPAQAAAKINSRTRAIIAVDYAGQPCDYGALRELTGRHGLALVADACHALGAEYSGRAVGTLADLNVFSFHPVKHIATGEGGMILTADSNYAARMQRFRNHGITTDHRQREEAGSWFYEMVDLGFNYRLTDLQCMLGLSQLRKLSGWLSRRREIASRYDQAFADVDTIRPQAVRPDVRHAYHLYVIRLALGRLRAGRREVFRALRAEGIGVNVHYVPVHLHPYYRRRFGTGPGLCPLAEEAYQELLTLPLFPRMSDVDVDDVIAAVRKVVGAYRR